MLTQKYLFSLYHLIYIPYALHPFNKLSGVPAMFWPLLLFWCRKTAMNPSNRIPVLIGRNK